MGSMSSPSSSSGFGIFSFIAIFSFFCVFASVAADQCVPGSTYSLNGFCTACPDAFMSAKGITNCDYVGFTMSDPDAPYVDNVYHHFTIAKARVYVFGAKGGEIPPHPTNPDTFGGNGGFVAAEVDFTTSNPSPFVWIEIGPSPSMRFNGDANSKIVAAGEGGWGNSFYGRAGGAGGGLVGANGADYGILSSGFAARGGTGGTQTAAGTSLASDTGYTGLAGGIGVGGAGYPCPSCVAPDFEYQAGGRGGNGWYGGGGGGRDSGGGGGSSYVRAATPFSASTLINEQGGHAERISRFYVRVTACRGSYYLNGGACVRCPLGKFGPLIGSGATTVSSACTLSCPPGKYGKSTDDTEAIACDSCPAGTFMASSGASACTSCPAGKMTLDLGSISSSSCTVLVTAGFERASNFATARHEFTVPAGVQQLRIDAYGARGGDADASKSRISGNGGFIAAKISVVAGNQLSVVMGAAPDIRTEAFELSTRLVVAGAGGGENVLYSKAGGVGGGLVGGGGVDYNASYNWKGGAGGTQVAGGAAPGAATLTGSPGEFGFGGLGYQVPDFIQNGGRGGDGWYGGGGGGRDSGGGGGSSYAAAGSLIISNVQGIHSSLISRLYITVSGCAMGFYLDGIRCIECSAGKYGFASGKASEAEACAECPTGMTRLSGGGLTCTVSVTIGYVRPGITSEFVKFEFRVPAGVEQIRVDAIGAMGSDSGVNFSGYGGKGGYLAALVSVQGGSLLTVGMGPAPDIRTSSNDLNTRLVVAGEGGWAYTGGSSLRVGGNGGGFTGAKGDNFNTVYLGGEGGSQTAGGANTGSLYTTLGNAQAQPGDFGYGGTAGCCFAGGRGGNGWYGGGGGGPSAGGGGGSSYAAPETVLINNEQGYHASLLSRLYITITRCKEGYYLDGVTCRGCAAGKYGDANGKATAAEACTYSCPTGKYGTVVGETTEVGACNVLCPAGTFGKTSGSSSEATGCSSCPANTMSHAGATSLASCVAVTVGYARTENMETSYYNFVVPRGVQQLRVDAFGAMGYDATAPHSASNTIGGRGGYLAVKISVVPGALLTAVLGPAPDIRTSREEMDTRMVVAGEGGWGNSFFGKTGGAGGGPVGANGANYGNWGVFTLEGGTGGTQTAAGTSLASDTGYTGLAGGIGVGGAGYPCPSCVAPDAPTKLGGRGGDGWYGGGGGGRDSGGGGGSSYAAAGSLIISNVQGIHSSLISRLYITVSGCAMGFYLDGIRCIECSAGKYGFASGKASEVEACNACSAGKYGHGLASGIASEAEACNACAENRSYCGGTSPGICSIGFGSVDDGDSCISCIPNVSYKATIGNVPCSNCVPGTVGCGISSAGTCAVGYEAVAGGSPTDWSCRSCASSTFKSAAGNNDCTGCVDNSVGCGGGSAGLCAVGHGALNGGSIGGSCIPCQISTYKTTASNTVCIPCSENVTGCGSAIAGLCSVGFGAVHGGSRGGSCTECTGSTYKRIVGNGACRICSANSYGCGGTTAGACSAGYVTTDNAATCTACGTGEYEQGGVCQSCEVGKYGPKTGATICVICPAGKASDGVGSSFPCVDCLAGSFASAGSSTCSRCSPGRFSGPYAEVCANCTAGAYSFAGQQVCQPCAAGTFSIAASSRCTLCEAGKFSSWFGTECSICRPGMYSDHGQQTCIFCPPNTYSLAGASRCVPCPKASYSRLGSSTCDMCAA